jgi:hypothetical protein
MGDRPKLTPRATHAVLALGVWLMSGGKSLAQGNDRSAPSGGRSALMGNTGVALGRDGAAPFLNPATIVAIGDQSVAFSVNFFTVGYEHYSDWHQPGPVDTGRFGAITLKGTGEVSDTFKALPSTLCLFFTVGGIASDKDDKDDKVEGWHAGKRKLAICLGSLEATDAGLTALSFYGATASGSTAQVQAVNRSWNRLSVGPTYSMAVSDAVSVGASLHGVSTGDTFSLQENSGTSVPGGGPLQSGLAASGNGHAIDTIAILGGTWRHGPFTVGLSAQVPLVHLYGKYAGTVANQYAVGGASTQTLMSGSGDFHAPPPVRLALGAGTESKRLTLELDVSYDFAQSEALSTSVSLATTTLAATTTATTASATYAVPGHGVLNAGAGAEYFLSPSFSVVGGLSTNLSSLRPLSPTMTVGNLAPVRQSALNLSLGIGSYGRGGDLMLGTQLSYGWGEALTANPYSVPNEFAVVDTQSFSALIVLAGTTNLRTLGRAAKAVEEVVTEGKPDDAPTVQPGLMDPKAAPQGFGAHPATPSSPATNAVPLESDGGAPVPPAAAPPTKTSPTEPPANAPEKVTPAKPSVFSR